MSANTSAAPTTAKPLSLTHLSDAELLAQTRSVVGRSNRLLAELLANLGEVEARGIHRTRACSSLYTYCIYELRFSEDEAFRRVAAARLVRRFPAVLDAVAAGELHLTGLLMLGPHLTEQNVVEVMARAKHRTKREIARLVRVLDPLQSVPACIEPLGPAPARLVPSEPSWEQFVGAMNPVRELPVGDRPREWGVGDDEPASGLQTLHTQNEANPMSPPDERFDSIRAERRESVRVEMHAPARMDAELQAGSLTSQRYKVQFTATEEYVRLVDEAKALLSHAAPRASLEDVQLRAMRTFVAALRKRKYGARAPGVDAAEDESSSLITADGSEPARIAVESPARAHAPTTSAQPRRRGRHIPAAMRRVVATRDGHRCTYVDTSGRRCSETRHLEFHHIVPFALSPSHHASNLTLRCRAHNALAAEEDFGRALVRARTDAGRHDRFHK